MAINAKPVACLLRNFTTKGSVCKNEELKIPRCVEFQEKLPTIHRSRPSSSPCGHLWPDQIEMNWSGLSWRLPCKRRWIWKCRYGRVKCSGDGCCTCALGMGYFSHSEFNLLIFNFFHYDRSSWVFVEIVWVHGHPLCTVNDNTFQSIHESVCFSSTPWKLSALKIQLI